MDDRYRRWTANDGGPFDLELLRPPAAPREHRSGGGLAHGGGIGAWARHALARERPRRRARLPRAR